MVADGDSLVHAKDGSIALAVVFMVLAASWQHLGSEVQWLLVLWRHVSRPYVCSGVSVAVRREPRQLGDALGRIGKRNVRYF
jgi:hypothetical protein